MKKFFKVLALFLTICISFSLNLNSAYSAEPKITLIKNIDTTIYIKQSYTLPKMVVAIMSNGTNQKVAVTWNQNNASTNKTGTFQFKGTVKGYNKKVLLTMKVVATPKYQDPELARAVSLGIGSYKKNGTVTYKQLFGMLDNVVALTNPKIVPKWKTQYLDARKSNKKMLRQEGMLAIFYAAKALGQDYYTMNYDWGKIHNQIGDSAWEDFSWNYPLFPDWNQEAKIGDNDWNNMTTAYFYSFGRYSLYSDASIFDFDPVSVSMNPSKSFSYEDALRAVLRLHDSGIQVTKRSPSEKDKFILSHADDRRNTILNSESSVKITGTAYYVSNSGNDNNDGKTPKTAWATIAKVNSMSLRSGDGIFFERDGLWREIPIKRSDITYSAYGQGAKPKIYGSPENGTGEEKWSLLKGTKNIWVFYKELYDVGGIVFNEGAEWATRIIGIWNGKQYVESTDPSTPININKLDNYKFFHEVDYTGYSTQESGRSLDRKGKLYLRCDDGNPGKLYSTIEFLSNPTQQENGGGLALLEVVDNCVVDNLCIMYGCELGIMAEGNAIVQNCEVGWIGGCISGFNGVWLGVDATAVVRAGDGIVHTKGSDGKIINNYVHHTYDNGLIEETGPWFSEEERNANNLLIKGNLVEKCAGGVYVVDWASIHTNSYDLPLFDNILIEDNYILDTNYGWSHQGLDEEWGIPGEFSAFSVGFGFPDKCSSRIVVKNNVFYLSKYGIVGGKPYVLGDQEKAISYSVKFSGNTYVQNTCGILAEWGTADDGNETKKYYYNLYAQNTVKKILGDYTGVLIESNK